MLEHLLNISPSYLGNQCHFHWVVVYLYEFHQWHQCTEEIRDISYNQKLILQHAISCEPSVRWRGTESLIQMVATMKQACYCATVYIKWHWKQGVVGSCGPPTFYLFWGRSILRLPLKTHELIRGGVCGKGGGGVRYSLSPHFSKNWSAVKSRFVLGKCVLLLNWWEVGD